MAESWYPNPAVDEAQHERLMGVAWASGVIGHPSDPPVVYAPNSGTREIRVRASRRAVVKGYGWENGAAEIVLPALAANATGSLRVDLVVLRLDRTDWSVRVKVVQGTPGSGAPAFSNADTGAWELPLAEVAVASGATVLAGSTVTNRAWYIGADGHIRCTSTTRPPVVMGRTVWEYPSSRHLVSDGTTWLVGVEDSGEVTLPLAAGWVASVNKLHRRNGFAFLDLALGRTGGNVAANATVTLGTLPAGFRPPYLLEAVLVKFDGSGRLSINTAGLVTAVFFDGLLTSRYANFQALTFPTA